MNKVHIAGLIALALIGGAFLVSRQGDDSASELTVLDEQAPAAPEPDVAGVTTIEGEEEQESYNRTSAPAIELTRLNGEPFSLAAYQGEKPVVIDFWASWCHNCQRDMPKLSKLYDQYKNDVEVIGVNLQETSAKAQAFVDSRAISFPIVMDPGAEVSAAYGIQYTNTHVLIDKRGGVAGVISGDITEEHITGLIEDSRSL